MTSSTSSWRARRSTAKPVVSDGDHGIDRNRDRCRRHRRHAEAAFKASSSIAGGCSAGTVSVPGKRRTSSWTSNGAKPRARNHSATHLLHLAAPAYGARGARSAEGSRSSGPDRLRFDFTHGQIALRPTKCAQVENLVNASVSSRTPPCTAEVLLASTSRAPVAR